MHASLLPLDEPESSNAANWEINSESSQSPLQTLHHLRQSYSPQASSHAGSGRNAGDQFEDIDLPNLNNINSSPVLSMFSNKSLIQNSEFVLDDTARDDGLISTSKTDTSMSDTTSDSNFQARKTNIGSVHQHPTMTGMFRLGGRIFNKLIIFLARPTDANGNFLNNNEPPAPSEPHDPTDWSPFTSRTQLETAEFLFQRTQMSTGNIDELMTLWMVSGGEQPFVDHTSLYNTIDAIPVGGVPWESFAVSYQGARPETNVPPWMEETYEVYFRDPHQLFLNMLANPSFAEHLDLMPMRIFDIKGSRRYENFMSGDWAWKQAVWLLHL